jgi:hypothetical protein
MTHTDEEDDLVATDRNEYELGGLPGESSLPPEEATDEPPSGFPFGLLAAGLAVVVVLAAVILFLMLRRSGTTEVTEAPIPTALAVPVQPSASPTPEPTPEPLALPPLDQSDDLLRELAGKLSSRPELAAWLANQDLARRFVATVDNVAAGESPARHLSFLAPSGRFRAAGGAHAYVIDPRSYERYDVFAAVISSIDAAAAVRLLGQVEPLLVAAYRELGYPDGRFRETLKRAAARMLAVPVLEGEVPVVPAVLTYRFADPKLESLSPAEKQLLRMGPRNVRLVQGKLRELLAALEAESAEAAPAAHQRPVAAAPEGS